MTCRRIRRPVTAFTIPSLCRRPCHGPGRAASDECPPGHQTLDIWTYGLNIFLEQAAGGYAARPCFVIPSSFSLQKEVCTPCIGEVFIIPGGPTFFSEAV